MLRLYVERQERQFWHRKSAQASRWARQDLRYRQQNAACCVSTGC